VKCKKCGAGAVIELRRHNTAFCTPDFLEFFRNQVREAIRRHRMFRRDERAGGRVGGKDSLASGTSNRGRLRDERVHRDLGIFEYGGVKGEVPRVRRGARRTAIISTVAEEVGGPIPVIQQVTRRPPCRAAASPSAT
jgi:hypothetical protein